MKIRTIYHIFISISYIMNLVPSLLSVHKLNGKERFLLLSISTFLQEMIPLYLMVIIGFISRKYNILPFHATDTITHLLLYITLPLLILFSLNTSITSEMIIEVFWLISMSLFMILSSVLFAAFMRKIANLPKEQKTVYESLIIFGNQGFIGFAIIYIVMSDLGIRYITLFNICYLILIWSYGIYLFTKKKHSVNWKLLFLNPGVISTTLGTIILFSPFQWPTILSQTFEVVGKMTIPLSMLLIGCLLAEVNHKQLEMYLKNIYIWIAAISRLCVIPLFLFIFLLINTPYPLFVVAVLTSAMPSASTVSIYAQKFGGDVSFSSVGIMITNVLCVVTIPLIYYILLLIESFY
jgi:predicted permease